MRASAAGTISKLPADGHHFKPDPCAFGDGGDRCLTISHHAAVRHENCCRPAGEAVTERDRLHRCC